MNKGLKNANNKKNDYVIVLRRPKLFRIENSCKYTAGYVVFLFGM